jgi:hypothetical protein
MCPDGFACEGISYRANLDQLPGCGGVGCSNQATTSCECVPAGSVCGGSCSSDICSFDIVFDHGECGAGKHCAMDVDYFCVLPTLSCPVGCVVDSISFESQCGGGVPVGSQRYCLPQRLQVGARSVRPVEAPAKRIVQLLPRRMPVQPMAVPRERFADCWRRFLVF